MSVVVYVGLRGRRVLRQTAKGEIWLLDTNAEERSTVRINCQDLKECVGRNRKEGLDIA